MTDKTIYVYSLRHTVGGPRQFCMQKLQFSSWRPGISKLIPPNSPFSYLYLWFMHYLFIFKNRDYSAFTITDNGKNICSLVCVPALYKWPFMNKNDLQIKNVFTHDEHRGKGYASWLIQYTLIETANNGRVYWYMTDKNNIPSQKLCKKMGFIFEGRYQRKRNKYLLYQGKITKDS